jgi:hypothetical protein
MVTVAPLASRKTGHWMVRIYSLKFKVQHSHGTQNIVADTLSCTFDRKVPCEPKISCHAVLGRFPFILHDVVVLQL